jgi:hypothetical protein
MPLEEAEELAAELTEFGYRERPTTPTRPADAVKQGREVDQGR